MYLVLVCPTCEMRQRKQERARRETQRPYPQPPRFMRPLPEVRHEDDDEQDPEVVRARDKATLNAGEVEPAFERGRHHVNDAVDGHALGEAEETQADEEADGTVTELEEKKKRACELVKINY